MGEIHLDGGEVMVLKAIGFGSGAMSGKTLLERVPSLEEAELLDTLHGLTMLGYLIADKQSLHTLEDIGSTNFHVNSGYSKKLQEAIEPQFRPVKRSRRVRRE